MHTFFYSNIFSLLKIWKKCLMREHTKQSYRICTNFGWKAQFFKTADVSILGHGYDVSQYPQFYDRIIYIYQMLPRPYVGIYVGEEGRQFLQEPWIIALAKSVEIFIMV